MINVETLKKKVLDLAMRGKLVPQDANDEPASVLIEKIKAEKDELIKAKKIKKTKALPPIEPDEIPYQIPNGWEWVRLGEASLYIQRGRSPKYSKKSNDYLVVSQKCIQWNKFDLNKAKFLQPELIKKYQEIRFLKKGDLLWNSTGTGTVGRIIEVDKQIEKYKRVVVDSHVTVIRTINPLNSYLKFFISSPHVQNKLDKILSGTTNQKELGLKNILELYIPLPPLAEQKRIVTKIEEIFAELDKIESASNEYDKCKELLNKRVLDLAMRGKLVPQDANDEPASVLIEKIKAEKDELIKAKKIKKTKALPPIESDEIPYQIPDSWEWVRLGEIGIVLTGNTPKKSDKENYGGCLPFIKPNNINYNYLEYNTNEKLSKIGKKKARVVPKNSLLVTCIGNLGRNFVTNREVAFNQQINSITFFNGINYELIHFFISSSIFYNLMYHASSATTVRILNKSKFEKLIIPLPPLAEQKRIVTKIEEIQTQLKEK